DISTQIISFVNDSIQSSGNQIFFNGEKFTVDPECMGLKMVITGYLLTLVMIAWFERRSKKELTFLKVILILLIVSILIIISNLFRIIGIIFAKAAPETFLHEMIGISSLIVYVVIPVYFLSRFFYKKFATPVKLKIEKGLQKNLSYGFQFY
ncbi:MAG: archaeosortase/exosortase family protein, partial [Chloroflexia bacterium]|nr:archaeosortase/exosortase family protein [Chloroflexia bacterium]